MTRPPLIAPLTTLGVGGPAEALVEPRSREELIAACRAVWEDGEEPLILGGGSNVLVSDEGYAGAVILVSHAGIERLPAAEGRVRLRVSAGVEWDELVAHTVDQGWNGIEALSGIPGRVGAAPIQNIGAYGQELQGSLTAVELLDRWGGEPEWVPAADLGLGYRTSVLKRHLGLPAEREAVVLGIELDLGDDGGLSAPIGYAQLAQALGADLGDRLELRRIRESVLALRAAKGMVYDPADPDSHSAGSFFTNPIVTETLARGLPSEAPRWPVGAPAPEPTVIALERYTGTELPPLGAPAAAEPALVKLSAAWLIEHAGIARGFALPGSRAAISRKHTLALTNAGGAGSDDILGLARYVQTLVESEFGVRLQPEPVLVGIDF